ncbi:type II secretion system F family protein [Fodinisporobacter ferrooxydans]|uniref:Type II secretion system F family protein n=1 Tax=Fodinisporobacter ferrooxydans TaxID=2901836 RepID=A0ABY4CL30_9BACL|nr:type II secretion system F family protein [Alicyclobacillaceae bacterium MYW30-H2]
MKWLAGLAGQGRLLIFRWQQLTQRRIPLSDIVRWTRMFHGLLAAGLPISDCLQTLYRSESLLHPQLTAITGQLLQAIHQGERVSASLHSTRLPALFVHMVQIGEETGELALCLQMMKRHYQQQLEWQRQIRKLLTYPLTILLATCILLSFLAWFVLPQFQSMYQMMGIHVSESLQLALVGIRYGLPAIGVCGIGMLLLCWFRVYQLWQQPQRLAAAFLSACKYPFIRMYLKLWFSVAFAESLGILLQAGVSLSQSLQIMEMSKQQPLLQYFAERFHQSILQGDSPTIAAQSFPFTNDLLAMIQLAEQTGDLAGNFTHAAHVLREEWRDAIGFFIERLQPVFMIVIGGFVGGTVLLVLLPMFQLMSAM